MTDTTTVPIGVAAGVSTGAAASATPAPTTRGQRFLDRVADVLADLVEVKVVTIVGDVDVTVTSTNDGKTTETVVGTTTVKAGSIISIFKVIDGDVTTVISPDVKSDTDLLARHEAQLEASLKVLPDHLKTLVEIAKSLDDVF